MTIKEIEIEHPLALEYETDARYVWPKRWATIQAELDKPITEHPDVQRLIGQVVKLQAENKHFKQLAGEALGGPVKEFELLLSCERLAQQDKSRLIAENKKLREALKGEQCL